MYTYVCISVCVRIFACVCAHIYMSVLVLGGGALLFPAPLPASLDCQLPRTGLWSVSLTAVFLVPGTQEVLS